MFTELHDEVNVSGKALNCPVHELVGAWEALPCPLHFAARGRELFTALHDWRGHVAIKEHRVKALGVELAVSGTEVSVYDAAVLLDGLSSSIAGGLQSAQSCTPFRFVAASQTRAKRMHRPQSARTSRMA